jgi:diguanylate cyclase (GGDEF)-like protein
MPANFKVLSGKETSPIVSRLKTYFLLGLFVSIAILLLQIGLMSVLADESQRVQANTVLMFLTCLMPVAVLSITTIQTRRLRPRLYPSWLLLTVAVWCNPLAALIGMFYYYGLGGIPSPSTVDALNLAIYPLFLLMVALLPSSSSRRLELIQWGFDALIITLSTGLIFFNFIIGPDILAVHASHSQMLASVAYLAGDLAILWALIMLLLRRFTEQTTGPLWWLFGAFGLLLIYDLSSTQLPQLIGVLPYSTIKETLLTGSLLFLMMSGLQQWVDINRPIMATNLLHRPGRWETMRLMMPYTGLAAAYVILIMSLTSEQVLSSLVVALWVAVIIGLVIIRQALVVRENQRLSQQLYQLNAELEERVEERTAALSLAYEELREREERLTHNALHDSLTGLPNRVLLTDRLDQAIRRMRRIPTYSFGVLFMDLDGFKVVNDSLGHIAGDRLLVDIAHRLSTCVREIDTVARLGGDEFVILLDGFPAVDHLAVTAKRVLTALSEPFDFDGQQTFMAASMGIVPGSPDYVLPADILRDADLAMYEAKALGKARYVLFTPELRSYALNRMMLEKDLRLAMERHELKLYYQPILNLKTGRVAGCEALLRWQHPTLGMVSPGSFVPVAEANGLITPITFWALSEALHQLSAWHKEFATSPPLTISVNLSARLFNQSDLLQQVERLLAETGVPARCLMLEVTESAIIQDTGGAIIILNACQKLGVRVHMDDFGTGYSSLSYLHQFPINTLKVAQDFVSRIQPNGENAEIVRTIVALAHDLNIEVIAEGIETAEQLDYICRLGCEGGQGYFISYPLISEEVGPFIVGHTQSYSLSLDK